MGRAAMVRCSGWGWGGGVGGGGSFVLLKCNSVLILHCTCNYDVRVYMRMVDIHVYMCTKGLHVPRT